MIFHEGDTLKPENKPEWLQTQYVGYFRMPLSGGEMDCHYHDHNELYLISRGKARIRNGDAEYYVKANDIVCIQAGNEHDILEIYGDEDLEMFWMYEQGAEGIKYGHQHRSSEKAQPHPVPVKPIPPDFPV